MRKKIYISKEELEQLYYRERKSKYTIGRIYGCSFKTVLNRMREYGMQPLSRSAIQSTYQKYDFSGSLTDKAYMIGFRLGDLNVYQTTAHSEVIVVRGHTTVLEQVEVIKSLFDSCGRVSISQNSKTGSYQVNCFLNETFRFLLPKRDKVEQWITNDDKNSAAFAAGYIEAEGNIKVYDGRARLKLDTYDKNIISWFYQWFKKEGIQCPPPYCIGKKGFVYNSKHNYKYAKDLWRIRVNKADELEKLFTLLQSHLRHAGKIRDIELCLNNIYERRKRRIAKN